MVDSRTMQVTTLTALVVLLVASRLDDASSASLTKKQADLDWWKLAVFYQIYPRSFKDSNNDGIGDLKGIIEKMPHFPKTGVDAIWLSPIFRSPQVDQGYDISDYRDVDPDYGTLEDADELIRRAHELGIRVILDYVPNHTSDMHEWFKASENGDEKYGDFYVWADGKVNEDGSRSPPNNWVSAFRNSAWTWSDKRQQFYLHQFDPAQPDLNYRNPQVVQEMKDVLTFWMDRGVDGFRMDAVPFLFEDPGLPDEPPSNLPGHDTNDYEYLEHIYTNNQPETYDMIYQWREHVDEYTKTHGTDQKILMTEAYCDTEDLTMRYYGTADGERRGAHFTFNFNYIKLISMGATAKDIASATNMWLDAIPEIYTSNWVLGNHDNHRVATRFGPQNVDGFNMLMAILPGVGVTYNGEEIGMEDGEVTFEEGQDPSARDPAIFNTTSRDFERTPYHWDSSVNAGFNEGAKPWLPVSQKYLQTNLQDEILKNTLTHYSIYQSLMNLRKRSEELQLGDVEVEVLNEQVLMVKRSLNGKSKVLIFNTSDGVSNVNVAGLISRENTVEVSSVNSMQRKGVSVDPENLALNPNEALILASSA